MGNQCCSSACADNEQNSSSMPVSCSASVPANRFSLRRRVTDDILKTLKSYDQTDVLCSDLLSSNSLQPSTQLSFSIKAATESTAQADRLHELEQQVASMAQQFEDSQMVIAKQRIHIERQQQRDAELVGENARVRIVNKSLKKKLGARESEVRVLKGLTKKLEREVAEKGQAVCAPAGCLDRESCTAEAARQQLDDELFQQLEKAVVLEGQQQAAAQRVRKLEAAKKEVLRKLKDGLQVRLGLETALSGEVLERVVVEAQLAEAAKNVGDLRDQLKAVEKKVKAGAAVAEQLEMQLLKHVERAADIEDRLDEAEIKAAKLNKSVRAHENDLCQQAPSMQMRARLVSSLL